MQLGDAVESRSLPLTQARYSDTADALREVVAVLALSLDLEFGPDDPVCRVRDHLHAASHAVWPCGCGCVYIIGSYLGWRLPPFALPMLRCSLIL
jgi:hypothetical protein